MPLHKYLRKKRIKMNFSQHKVANNLHISRQAISQWENGKSSPDVYNLLALSKLYDFDLNELPKIQDNKK